MSSFGPGGRGFECLKQDIQKAGDAEVPTYMWDHFFEESFLRKFRSHIPEGWRTALDGFRRLAVRRWRRNLLQSFHRWRSENLRGKLESRFPRIFRLVSKDDRGRPVYSWTKQGKSSYQRQAEEFSRYPRTSRTLKIAGDGIERAAGHLVQDHPDYFACFWEWTMGSTPFFWNWPTEYQEDVWDGQPHYRVSCLGKPFRVPQKSPKSEQD